MDKTVLVALIVAVASMVSPLLLASLTNRQRTRDKHEDWKRQDEVAKRLLAHEKKADAQAQEAAETAEETVRLVRKNHKLAETSAKTTEGKLEGIHKLVNSNLTEQMKVALDALEGQLLLLRAQADSIKSSGCTPPPGSLAFIKEKQKQVDELRSSLNDRLQTEDTVKRGAVKKPAAARIALTKRKKTPPKSS